MRVVNKMLQTANTWNGAISNSSTGSSLLDYFSKVGTYTNRSQEQVNADISSAFYENRELAKKLVFATRLITRNGSSGFGRKDEFYKQIVWLHENEPTFLYNNLPLIPVFGCWRDFFTEPLIDTLYRNDVFDLINGNFTDQLIFKYLPQIRSKARSPRDAKRIKFAKDFCKYFSLSHKTYRSLKSKGLAHEWQRQMSTNAWQDIDLSTIPGKAMFNSISRKGKDNLTVFERHGLVEKLKTLLKIPFTGYAHDLVYALHNCPTNIQKFVYDKQFENILKQFSNHSLGNVLSCLDISGSMESIVTGKIRAVDICLGLGFVFSSLNCGYFKDMVCGFSDNPILVKLNGSLSERFNQLKQNEHFQRVAWGSTNIQGVVDLLVKIRKNNPEIPLNEFPQTLLIVSDMQFNAYGEVTNADALRNKLNSVGLNPRIIWWQVNGATSDFPVNMNDDNFYLIGGFDATNLNVLMNKEIKEKEKVDPYEGMVKFLSQPIFNLIT